jgi:hypothetical protein
VERIRQFLKLDPSKLKKECSMQIAQPTPIAGHPTHALMSVIQESKTSCSLSLSWRPRLLYYALKTHKFKMIIVLPSVLSLPRY